MFKKILIANRGEIAVRIAKTAAQMGIETVAVYSDVDKNALHVASADQAVYIGGSVPRESYLNIERIIDAARATGAEAVHPGYGFLSENPIFAEAIEAAGLIFIGPCAKAIRAMGLKDAAKALMEQAKVPVVPGYHGPKQSNDGLLREATRIGFPLLIKAVAGGGGKGMRRVDTEAEFSRALASAKSEAQGAFANDAVLLEKFIPSPRHIEIQIFGDGESAVHMFERDCSMQRRYQKVIEEAPAPGMSDEMRAQMGKAAVRAAEAIGYKGAGTVEFIVDATEGLRPDRFWFMEMNTRLQVEHPVTEAVTGIDLVEWQLRVAAGEELPMAQDAIELSGHAFEARIYAEDPANGFMPVTGVLGHVNFPSGCRADSAIQSGDMITPFYDPMIAKLVVHGENRSDALAKFSQVLRKTQLVGSQTNLGFLIQIAEHDDFSRGCIDTSWIDRNVQKLTSDNAPSQAVVLSAALAVLTQHTAPNRLTGFHLWHPLKKTLNLLWKGQKIDFYAELYPDRVVLVSNSSIGTEKDALTDSQRFDLEYKVSGWWFGPDLLPEAFWLGNKIWVCDTASQIFDVPDPLDWVESLGTTADIIFSPMPGLVSNVAVMAGQKVEKDATLVVLEAMKMEHVLRAPCDCIVKEVLVASGDQVEAEATLILLENLGLSLSSGHC